MSVYLGTALIVAAATPAVLGLAGCGLAGWLAYLRAGTGRDPLQPPASSE